MGGRGRKAMALGGALVVAAAAAVGALLLLAGPAHAAERATLQGIAGQVSVRIDGADARPATSGMGLRAGDIVQTGSDGAGTIEYFDGSTTELSPDTTVLIRTLESVKGQAGSKVIRVAQTGGSTLNRIQKLTGSESRVEVITPTSTAGVAGTVFRVDVGADGSSVVSVEQGTVLVTSSSGRHAVPAGQRFVTRSSSKCSYTFAGVDGRTASTPKTAIKVRRDAVVPVTARARARITGHHIQLEFAGSRWNVSSGVDHGTSWAGTVNVRKYAKYAVGVYKVVGDSTGPGACSGFAFIKIKGKNPFVTIAGLGGTGAVVLGSIGLALATLRALRPRMGRRRLRVGASILGLIAGLLAALGALVLLQQTATVYPTRVVAIAGLVAGALAGVLLPALGSWLGRPAPAAPQDVA